MENYSKKNEKNGIVEKNNLKKIQTAENSINQHDK